MGKKIDDKTRPSEFSRIRDLVFKEAGVNYDASNPIQYETYRKSLDRFGLIDSFRNFKYPETILKYDLRKEEGVTDLMKEVAAEYSDLIKRYADDPKGIIPDLWPLFRVDYNPKFEAFADEKLAIADITLAQIDDILKTADGDEEESRDAAEGTGLETSEPNPIILAEELRRQVNLKYVESLGYKVDGIKDDAALLRYLRFNLADDKSSKEESKEVKPNESPSSPINQPTKETSSIKTSQASSNINLTEGVEPGGAENTTEGISTVTESKPEVVKPEEAPQPSTNINLNLEKAVEPSAAPEASAVSQSVINENTVSTPAPQIEPTKSDVTQQNIDLSTANTASSSTINTQNTGESVSTTGGGTMSSTSVNTTINQPALEPAKEKPGFFKKAMAVAGKALSPLAERLGENSKDMLEIANYRLNQVLPINTVSKLFSKKEKETTGSNLLNLTKSSPTNIDNAKTETNVAGAQTSNMSTTTNQPTIETNIEKINPIVGGNPTTATVETKTESTTPTTSTTPQAPTLTETSPSIPTGGSGPTPAPTQPQMSSGIDVSSLEKRLKKIEIALTNPLEVIIKDH